MVTAKQNIGPIDKVPESIAKKTSNSINLIPDITAKEKKKIDKKENINLTSAALVFLVMIFTVGLLLYNFSVRNRKSTAESKQAILESQLDSAKTKELKLKNTLAKYDALQELKKSDIQYSYLSQQVAEFPSTLKVKSISLSSSHEFEISGLAISAGDFTTFVDELETSEDFNNVTIEEVRNLNEVQIERAQLFNEDQYVAGWRITGDFFKNVTTSEVTNDLGNLTE